MATGGLVWSKKVSIQSVTGGFSAKYLTLDPANKNIYITSDYADTYFFICKLRSIDGEVIYCAKYGGDSADYPF